MIYYRYPEFMYFTTETGEPPTTIPSTPVPTSPGTPVLDSPDGPPLTPDIPLPSPDSPLVLPGDPNPEDKLGFIQVYLDITELYQQALRDEANVGYLISQVNTAYGTQPVANAKVTISKPLGYNSFLSQIVLTDEDGRTQPVPLPSRNPELSQQPGFAVPYTIYNLTAEAPGYYEVEVYDIPIFPGVTSIQPINLVPIVAELPRPPQEIQDRGPQL